MKIKLRLWARRAFIVSTLFGLCVLASGLWLLHSLGDSPIGFVSGSIFVGAGILTAYWSGCALHSLYWSNPT